MDKSKQLNDEFHTQANRTISLGAATLRNITSEGEGTLKKVIADGKTEFAGTIAAEGGKVKEIALELKTKLTEEFNQVMAHMKDLVDKVNRNNNTTLPQQSHRVSYFAHVEIDPLWQPSPNPWEDPKKVKNQITPRLLLPYNQLTKTMTGDLEDIWLHLGSILQESYQCFGWTR